MRDTESLPLFQGSQVFRADWKYYPKPRLSKRVIDLLGCILLLPVLLIVVPLLSLLIALDSPGAPIYIQERVGLGGKRFRVYKFRTMVCNRSNDSERTYMEKYVSGRIESDEGTLHKPIPKQDITRLGQILRKTSLDELPQVLNILKGEMSLIGPRPNVNWEVDFYKGWHYERLNTLPGITGLAQVMGRSSLSFDQIARFDIQYVRKQSLFLDIQIIWWTFKTVLSGRGAG
ncbi:MAG: sugar transferase [Chloroflexi bacterium]|nr:sugar transferase [Chloroflexota bacterium]